MVSGVIDHDKVVELPIRSFLVDSEDEVQGTNRIDCTKVLPIEGAIGAEGEQKR